MTSNAHLSAEQLARYQARTLEPGELLAVDRHLAACGECRLAACGSGAAEARVSELRALLSEHLSYQQVVACAEGAGDAGAEEHLAECASCRAEVEDLREFRRQLGARPRVVEMPRRAAWVAPAWVAAAAAVLVMAGLAVWNGMRPPAVPVQAGPVAGAPARPAEGELSAEQRDAVASALASRKLERAAVLDRLISHAGVLLGEANHARSFELSSPIGTSVIADRPVFRWQALRGATQYVVSVYDENFQAIAQSPEVGATEWQPATALPRGQVYVWQVSARVRGGTVRSPQPPAPEARFQVVGREAAEEIEQARRRHPGNHLLVAVLLARNGALDEAATELDALSATDPETAKSLRESLAQIRR